MAMKRLGVLFLMCISCSSILGQVPLLNGHAHNDYLNAVPLLGALNHGFISVEVDVHYINDAFWVAHDLPDSTANLKTLQELYLNPLCERIKQNNGRVYKEHDGFFYLMIDVKTDAEISYIPLMKLLSDYVSILSTVSDGIEEMEKPVKIFISGHSGRPFKEIIESEFKIAGLDGREIELGTGIPKSIMPVVSENYSKYFTWNGIDDEPLAEEKLRLEKFVLKAHEESKLVRLWASPDNPKAWTFLLEAGVDLINTDKLQNFKEYVIRNE